MLLHEAVKMCTMLLGRLSNMFIEDVSSLYIQACFVESKGSSTKILCASWCEVLTQGSDTATDCTMGNAFVRHMIVVMAKDAGF